MTAPEFIITPDGAIFKAKNPTPNLLHRYEVD